MALPVILKSGKNYMTLVLDRDLAFPDLLHAILTKFLESESFFSSEPFALAVEGRELTETEKCQMLDAIAEYTSINITTLIENDITMEKIANKAIFDKNHPNINVECDLDEEIDFANYENNCLFLARDILDGENIEVKDSIYIKGNVSSGAIIKAGNSITILGELNGQAIAGNDSNAKAAYIFAYKFKPTNFRIGRYIGDLPVKKKFNFRKNLEYEPKIVQIVDGEIRINSLKL